MAGEGNEGVAAALVVSPQIEESLKRIEGTLNRMADGADKLAKQFGNVQTNAVNLANTLSKVSSGMSLNAKFNTKGILRDLQIIVNAAQNMGQTRSNIAKQTFQTEAQLQERLNAIYMKDVNTKNQVISTLKALKKYQDDFNASSQNAIANGNAAFNDKGYQQSIAYYTALDDRLKSLKMTFDSLRASTAVNDALSRTATDAESAREKIASIKNAFAELNKVGGDSAAFAPQITQWKSQLDAELKAVQQQLPNFRKQLQLTKKEATEASRALVNAMKKADGSNVASLQNKLQLVTDALTRLKQLAASGNTFVPHADIAKGDAEVQRITADLQKLIAEEQKLKNDAMSGLGAALSSFPNSLEKMSLQYDRLKASLRELNRLSKLGIGIDPKVIAATSAGIDALNKRIEITRARMNTTAGSAQMVATMISMAFSPIMISQFLRQLIKVRGEFEMSERSLAVLLKDANLARAMFTEIESIAVRSPFSVSQILKQTKQLAAYRIETDKLIQTTKMLGDISAGVGVDMNRLILAYGQVHAAEYLKGTELRQFSEAGVNMLGGLAEHFSELYQRTVSVGEVLGMITKKMVKFADVEAVLMKNTSAGGAFYQMQEKQAETLQGMITNLSDRLQIAFNEIGTSYDSLIKRIVKGLENLMTHWKAASVILIGLTTKGVSLGLFTIIGKKIKSLVQTFAAVNAAIKAEKALFAAAEAAGVASFGKITKAATFAGAAISSIGLANVLSLVVAIGAVIAHIVRQSTELERNVKRISEDIKSTQEQQVSEYKKLVGIVTNTEAKESDRVKALEKLKDEYNNILHLENIDLNNAEELNRLASQHTDIIRERVMEEGREEAMLEVIKELNRSGAKRQEMVLSREDAAGALGFVERFKDELQGLKLIDEKDIDSIRKEIENQLIDGTLGSAEEATKEFLKTLLRYAGAEASEIEAIMGDLGDNAYYKITTAFTQVTDKVQKTLGAFAKNDVDITIPKPLQGYKKAIEELDNAANEFNKSLTQAEKKAYESNPAQKQLDMQHFIEVKRKEIEDAIRNQSLGEISEEWARQLQDSLQNAFYKVSVGNKVEMWIQEQFAEVSEEFPNLKMKPGLGALNDEGTKDIAEYIKNLKTYTEEVENARAIIYSVDEYSDSSFGRELEVIQQWGRDAYTQYVQVGEAVRDVNIEMEKTKEKMQYGEMQEERDAAAAHYDELAKKLKTLTDREKEYYEAAKASAGIAINEELEATERLVQLLGKGVKSNKQIAKDEKEREARLRDIYKLTEDAIRLATSWDTLTPSEMDQLEQDVLDITADLDILPPEEYTLKGIADWIKNVVDKELNGKDALKIHVDAEKLESNVIKNLQSGFYNLGNEIVNTGRKWNDMTDEQKTRTKELLQLQLDELKASGNIPESFNNIELPEFFTVEGVTEWIGALATAFKTAESFFGQDIVNESDIVKLYLLAADFMEDNNKDNRNAFKQYQNDLKEFIKLAKGAANEFDKLDDAGDKMLERKIEIAAKKLGVSTPDSYNTDAVYKWAEQMFKKGKLSEADVLEIKLDWNKDDTADAIKKLSDEASALWDKYNNQKKLEGWGIPFVGGSSTKTLEEIYRLEGELRKKNTQESIQAADEIARHRTEITRTEQEEAAKLMYEAQKKALSKTEQAYQTMYENIDKIRNNAIKEGLDTNPTEDAVNAAVQAQVAKSMKEIAEAEWDAYKATEMYAMAFGDLDGLSQNVLIKLRDQLEAFKSAGNLNPTDMRTVTNTLKKLNDEIAKGANGGFYGVFVEGFKSAGEAIRSFREDIPGLQTTASMFLGIQAEMYKKWQEAEEAYKNGPTEANKKAVIDAYENFKNAQKNAESAVAALDEAIKTLNSDIESSDKKLGALIKAYGAVGDAVGGVIGVVEEFADTFGLTLSDEAQAALDGFQQGFALVGSAISACSTALAIMRALFEAMKSGAAAVLWPILAIGIAVGTLAAILKAKDAKISKQIESHKEAVENLQKTYDKLSDAMDKAIDLDKAMVFHETMQKNLEQQRQELEEALALNGQRKQNKDAEEEAKDLTDQLDEVKKAITDNEDEWLEFMGATSDWQGLARDWASSWLEAFKAGEDGLASLEESFDELWEDIVSVQLSDFLNGPINNIRKAIADALNNDGKITEEEARYIQTLKDNLKAIYNEGTSYLEKMGITKDIGEASGDTLQKGIESVSEQTAQALEGILNSTKFYVADNNRILQGLELTLVGEGENTILANIRSQTRYLQTLATIADAVYFPGAHAKGAGGIKVFVD